MDLLEAIINYNHHTNSNPLNGTILFNQNLVETKIRGMTIIPGSGEYVYDTTIQTKTTFFSESHEIKSINRNNPLKIADALYSLEDMMATYQKLEWVAPVVSWFTKSLDISSSSIYPATEGYYPNVVYSEEWKVANYTRKCARVISRDHNQRPNYGGTSNDNSIRRYLTALKSRGLKVMLYPMVFVDAPGKPWRGHMNGDPGAIEAFFRNSTGYNRFILHYARLCKGLVDAFVIGSELKGLTAIKDSNNLFPAVDELILLAAEVKSILGPKVIVTYAADWSEYHHTAGGWYHLDKLWASDAIDVIGIDYYMPMTRITSGRATYSDILQGFSSGEGYDCYYDGDNRKDLQPPYAWKNIQYWWSNIHTNPDGNVTEWIPKSKKIWFTEFGFPTIDKATNQPNVFYNNESMDGGCPRDSSRETDFLIQRTGTNAFLEYFGKDEYAGNSFLYAYDARPYPAWPHSRYWSDWPWWEKGHWVNGKLGIDDIFASLFKVLSELQSTVPFSHRPDRSTIDSHLHGIFTIISDLAKSLLAKRYLQDDLDQILLLTNRLKEEIHAYYQLIKQGLEDESMNDSIVHVDTMIKDIVEGYTAFESKMHQDISNSEGYIYVYRKSKGGLLSSLFSVAISLLFTPIAPFASPLINAAANGAIVSTVNAIASGANGKNLLKAAVLGSVSGLGASSIGSAFSGSDIATKATKVVAEGSLHGSVSAIGGGKFRDGFVAGAAGEVTATAVQGFGDPAVKSVLSGLGSAITARMIDPNVDFGKAFAAGMIIQIANHAAHDFNNDKLFTESVDNLLEEEKGYVDNKHDPGRKTKYGISQRSFPDLDIPNITKDDAKAIYYESFWKQYRIDQVAETSPGIGNILLDTAALFGPQRGVMMLQEALRQGLTIDGIIGPNTLNAISKMDLSQQEQVISNVAARRLELHQMDIKKHPEKEIFLTGWSKRAATVRDKSHALLKNVESSSKD